jgi:ELWxxDGT repeat protein
LEPRTLLAAATLLRDIHPGTGAESLVSAVAVVEGGAAFFTANDGHHGTELWKTDGTPEGTVLVKDILPGAESAAPTDFAVMNGRLFFVADDGAAGRELWASDGTEAGTVLVKDIRPGPLGSIAGSDVAVLHDTLLFVADDGVNGFHLWRSDGTAEGTVRVRPLGDVFHAPVPLGGAVVFTTFMGLFRTDGTDAGTFELTPGDTFMGVGPPVVAGGKAFFITGDPGTLWVSDGTRAGTRRVSGRIEARSGRAPEGLVGTPNGLGYFIVFNKADPRPALWRSDGTEAGTVRLKPIDAPFPDDVAAGYTVATLDNTVFFRNGAYDFSSGTQKSASVLWASDGTRRGTRSLGLMAEGVGAFEAAAGRMFVRAAGTQLWESFGAPSTTRRVELTAGEGGSPTPWSVVGEVGGRVLFLGDDGAGGLELWAFTPDPPPGGGGAGGGGGDTPGNLRLTVGPVEQEDRYAGGPAVVPVHVTNEGPARVRGTARVKLLLSEDAAVDSGDAEATVARPLRLRLAPGATRRFNLKVTLPPASVGTYRVIAEVDPDNSVAELVETDNAAVSADWLLVGVPVAPRWDHTVDPPAIRSTPPGGRVRVPFFLRNEGKAVARGGVAVEATLHAPGSTDAGRVVGRVAKPVTVKPALGEPAVFTRVMVPVVLPAELAPGRYVLRLTLSPDATWEDNNLADNTGEFLIEVT